MSSIRPLATITLLAAMGVFLYMKINEPPESETSPAPAEWDGAPKFEFGDAAPTGAPIAGSAAPSFTPPAAVPSAESSAPTNPPPAPASSAALPSAPPISAPSLPDVPPGESESDENSPQSELLAAATHVEIDASDSLVTAADSDGTISAAKETATVESAATESPSTESPAGLPPIPELPPLPEATTATETPSNVAPAPPEPAESTTPDASTVASESPFDAARPAIHAALTEGELARALQLVSKWYNDPALSPDEKEEVQTLLNQLAGTVIYSNEHYLEPAYTVQAGDTLETIAATYHVPWQLLAKINGIPSATAIQPEQTLKVIRGPFMGVVDVSDEELTLTLDGRFAGKFPVQLDGAAISEGEWTVEQKQLDPAYRTSSADHKLVLRSGDNTDAAIVIASSTTALAGTEPPQGTIRIAPEQAEDLYDILSIGSRMVIRR